MIKHLRRIVNFDKKITSAFTFVASPPIPASLDSSFSYARQARIPCKLCEIWKLDQEFSEKNRSKFRIRLKID